MGKISDQIWACWNRAVQVFNKINEQFWVFDEKILESRLGVYVYLITSAVIIGVLAAWVVMSPGVCGGGDAQLGALEVTSVCVDASS